MSNWKIKEWASGWEVHLIFTLIIGVYLFSVYVKYGTSDYTKTDQAGMVEQPAKVLEEQKPNPVWGEIRAIQSTKFNPRRTDTNTVPWSSVRNAIHGSIFAPYGNAPDFSPYAHYIVRIDTFGFRKDIDSGWVPILDTMFRFKPIDSSEVTE